MSNFETLIKKSLENYDYQKTIFRNEIDELDKKKDEITQIGSNKFNNLFKINNKDFKYEHLGIFHYDVFCWSWSQTFEPKILAIQSKYLLEYGLNLDPTYEGSIKEDDSFLKLILTNSRIKIKDEFQLDSILAIFSYLLNNTVDFIYKKKILNKPNTYQIYTFKLINKN